MQKTPSPIRHILTLFHECSVASEPGDRIEGRRIGYVAQKVPAGSGIHAAGAKYAFKIKRDAFAVVLAPLRLADPGTGPSPGSKQQLRAQIIFCECSSKPVKAKLAQKGKGHRTNVGIIEDNATATVTMPFAFKQ